MKILGRIALILAVFALVMGVIYVVVMARSSTVSGGVPAFEQGNGRLVPPNGTRPELRGRERNEFHGGILFGAIKNIAVIGFLVALIVIPKSWSQKRKRTAQPAS